MNTSSVTPTGAAIISLGALTLWGLYRKLFAKSPLSVLPGPPSPSFIYGKAAVDWYTRILLTTCSGHINQVFDPNGWDFFSKLQENYEAAVRLNGVLKVRLYKTIHGVPFVLLIGWIKSDLLYIFDPLALHHMLLKNQDAFDTSRAALT